MSQSKRASKGKRGSKTTRQTTKNPSEGKGFFKWVSNALMLLLTIAFAVLLLISAKASVLSPEKVLLCAYPNYLFLPLALLNLLFFIYWVTRPSFRALIPIVCLAICMNELATWFPVHFGDKSEQVIGKQLKVLTYNTMRFSGRQKPTKGTPNPVLAYLTASDADIICLQEATTSVNSKYISEKDVLSAMKSYRYKVKYPYMGSSNLWIFSRYPIVSHGRISYKTRANGSCYCDVNVDGTRLRIINNHLESNKLTISDKELYKAVISQHDKESVSQAARQINDKLGPAASLRAQQADAVAKFISESPYPVIVCGDCNDIPCSYTYRTLSKGLTDSWKAHRSGLGITFHEKFIRFRIDYMFHSPLLHSADSRIDKVKGSDHYPLWTTFRMTPD